MIRKGIRPAFRFGFEKPLVAEYYQRVFPFRRSWFATAFILAMDIIFTIPAISTFRQIMESLGRFETLFDLVGVLFLGGWLLGWSIAPLALTTILVLLLFGREVVRVGPGVFEITIGLPGLGWMATYDPQKMRNLRIDEPHPKSGKSFRGPHIAFDYGANSVAFGSDLDLHELGEMESQLQMASGKPPRKGAALPEELGEQWENIPQSLFRKAETEVSVEGQPKSWATPSALLLIVANLVPVAGAAFLGWKLSDVMVLYWAESAIIGLFNIAKIAVIGRWFALLAGPFFIGHFGAFMAVHFLFIYGIFVEGFAGGGPSDSLQNVAALFIGLWPALLALTLSHGYSFFANFLGKGEYRRRTVSNQMNEPYSRIVFMHLVLIFGGGLAMFLGEPTIVILIVIALKILVDIRAHVRQRSKASANVDA
ncbi:MAG: DUF6498-containing protein [Xanthomonadales bacterium]|jgi:hypothetical protein|nr:DUF6498-containing protein [Xanthomonadales bacterium]